MKTIGMVLPRRDSSCCRAGPLMPGIATSRTRQSVWSTNPEARNSAAEENARDANPNVRRRSGRDSRTDSSSSTIDTRRSLGTRSPSRNAASLTARPSSVAISGLPVRSPEREGEHLHSRIQELDLEPPIGHGSWLSNELIQPRFGDRAKALIVDVDSV